MLRAGTFERVEYLSAPGVGLNKQVWREGGVAVKPVALKLTAEDRNHHFCVDGCYVRSVVAGKKIHQVPSP